MIKEGEGMSEGSRGVKTSSHTSQFVLIVWLFLNLRVVALPLRASLAELWYTANTATWYSVSEFR